MTQEDKWTKNYKKYYGKKVRVYENNDWYDGYISDVVEDDNGNTVFDVVDDDYGFHNTVKKEQMKEIVITKTFKNLE